jgi:hypothetical protein
MINRIKYNSDELLLTLVRGLKFINKTITLVIGVILLTISSCTTDITVDIPEAEEKIVIEGAIESGQYPWVIVTKNSNYFDPVDTNTIINMAVINAKVYVSDGEITDTLQFAWDETTIPYYKYVGSRIFGEEGKTYSLTVEVGNEVYTSKTTIPNIIEMDSIRFKPVPELENDSLGYLWFYFQDPDTIGNNYRIFSKTIDKDDVFVHPGSSAIDDKNVNGQYIEYPIWRGWNPNLTQEEREAEYEELGDAPRWAFIRGETVIFKFCTLDAEHYEFWRTIEVQNSSDGNPFASPTSVYTNIDGGALGIWGGYGTSIDTVHID